MAEAYKKIEKLLDLQKKNAERALHIVVEKHKAFLLEAEECLKPLPLPPGGEDVASAIMRDKFLQTRKTRAEALKQQAADLVPEIAKKIEELNYQLKRQAGLDEIMEIELRKQKLAEEEAADDEILAITQLGAKAM